MFSIKSLAGMCACAILAFALLAQADQGTGSSESVDVSIEAEAGVKTPQQPNRRGQIEGNLPGAPIRRVIKAAESRIQDNKDIRNEMLRNEQKALSGERKEIRGEMRAETSEMRGDIRGERREFRQGSSTPAEKLEFRAQMKAEREQIKSMRRSALVELKENRNKQLENAGKLLDGAESRLKSFIDKASAEGKDTAEATALLESAHKAIATAKADVAIFTAWKPSAETTASTTAETEIDITKPRQLFETAKASVLKAREALRKVAIALGLGEKKGSPRGGVGHADATTSAQTN